MPVTPPCLRLRPLLLLTIGLFVLCWPADAWAHAPHDEISALVISPNYLFDGTVFAIVRYNVLRSTDFGWTWHRLTQGLTRGVFLDLAISPAFATDRCVFASNSDDVFRSRDGGDSWVSTEDRFQDRHIDSLNISPHFESDRRLLATARNGQLYLTNDAGDCWVQCFGDDHRPVSAATFIGRTIVAGTSTGGAYSSNDNGAQWRRWVDLGAGRSITCLAGADDDVSDPFLIVGTSRGCVALAPDAQGMETRSAGLAGRHVTDLLAIRRADGAPVLFASTWREALFRSDDLGRSWRRDGNGLTTDRQADWPQFRKPHFKDIAVSSTFTADHTMFLAGFDGVFKSTDAGESWHEMRGALGTGLIVGLDVAQDHDGLRVAVSTYVAGVYSRSHGGDAWEINNVGLEGGRLSDIAFSPDYASDATLFALGNWSLFTSVDSGCSWTSSSLVGMASGRQFKISVLSSLRRSIPTLMRLCGRERVQRWKQGVAWLSGRAGGHIVGPGWGGVIAVSPDFATDRTLFVGGLPGVLRSTDGGRSFEPLLEIRDAELRSLAVSPDFAHDGTLFAAFDNRVLRSTDRGDTWNPLREGGLGAFPRLVLSPAYQRDQTVFLGGSTGLWRSRDGGRTWEALRSAAAGTTGVIDGLAVSPCFETDREIVVHIAGVGLCHSSDGGDSFSRLCRGDGRPGPAASHMMGFPDRASLIKFSPRYDIDRTVFVSSMEDLLRTTDLGRTWERVDRPVRFESVRPEIVYRGSWTVVRDRHYSSGSAMCASIPGATATMEFVGRGVRWIGKRGPGLGAATVLVDNLAMATIDQHAPAPSCGVVSFASADLSYGPHTVVIEVVGDGAHRSGGGTVIVDALDVF